MKFQAVLFDCDGVLVDSEPVTNGVLREMLAERGWQLSSEECMRTFIGKTLPDEAGLIAQRTGQPVTEAWLAQFRTRRDDALRHQIEAIPGITQVVPQLFTSLKGNIACASGADRMKVEMMLNKVQLMPYFAGRIFSGYEVPRSKPFPDVYLAAAAALGAATERCAVVEDTPTGVRAGVAAGATVFAYFAPGVEHISPDELRAAGAHQVFHDMALLPQLLAT